MAFVYSVRASSVAVAHATLIGLSLTSLATAPIHAETPALAAQAQTATNGSGELARFRPAPDGEAHTIDYAYLDEALQWFVIPMGPSIREGSRRPEARTGTRRVYGHTSRVRLEGNRVAFSFFNDDVRASLSEYRADLERIGTQLDIASLPRNEQLAFWMNLHNVAVIEALAYEYPLDQPANRTFGANNVALDDAKLVTIAGVALSPRDIREGIVYSNWRDPKVIYGFWRGEIGGPSLQRLAFNGDNLDLLLSVSAEEFVNSLRGAEKTGKTLRVSKIYEEAAPFYFENDEALRAHMLGFARDKVKKTFAKTIRTITNSYEGDLADLSLGNRDPALLNVSTQAGGIAIAGRVSTDINGLDATPQSFRPNLAVQRLMAERRQKLNKAIKRGIRTGQVIVGDGLEEGEEAKEIE